MVMLPLGAPSPAWTVRSVNTPWPSLMNNATPPPSVLTRRSRSPSPSTSAKTAPVEWRTGIATPAAVVPSSDPHTPNMRDNPIENLFLGRRSVGGATPNTPPHPTTPARAPQPEHAARPQNQRARRTATRPLASWCDCGAALLAPQAGAPLLLRGLPAPLHVCPHLGRVRDQRRHHARRRARGSAAGRIVRPAPRV